MRPCCIFCAGVCDSFDAVPEKDALIIAADGGVTHLKKFGLTADCVLGDFDSLGYVPDGAQVFPVQKDDTDAMLAVRYGLEQGCRRFYLYGALEGERLDHTVANFQLLQFLADHGAEGYLIGKRQIATVVQNGTAVLQGGGVLSVFCVGANAQGVTLTGVEYPLDNGTLTAGFPLGVSNHIIKEATVGVESGSLLLIYDKKIGFPTERKQNG